MSPTTRVQPRPRPSAKPAAVDSTPSMPLAPRLAATGAPRPVGTAACRWGGAPTPVPAAAAMDGSRTALSEEPSVPAVGGGCGAGVAGQAYMSRSRMGMLLPTKSASPGGSALARVRATWGRGVRQGVPVEGGSMHSGRRRHAQQGWCAALSVAGPRACRLSTQREAGVRSPQPGQQQMPDYSQPLHPCSQPNPPPAR